MLTKMCLDTGVYGESDNVARDNIESTRDQEEYSRDNTGLQHDVKRETEESSRDHDGTTRDKENCSRDNSELEPDSMKDIRESSRDHDEVKSDEIILDEENWSRDLYEQENPNSLLLNYENKTKAHDKQSDEEQPEWSCDCCAGHHNSIVDHILTNGLNQASRETNIEKERDSARASFLRTYFPLLRVQDIRRKLGVTPGYKHTSWCVLLDCIRGQYDTLKSTNTLPFGCASVFL
jgi:hypothetical protein